MYYKSENLNRDERIYNAKIKELVSWAELNGRQDISSKYQSYGEIRTMTGLKNAYYELLKLKKGEKNISSSNTANSSSKQTPMTETNTPPSAGENKEAASQPTPTPSPTNNSNGVDFDPLLSANPKQRDYTSGLGGNDAASAPQASIPEPDFKAEASGGLGSIPQGEKDNRFSDLPPNEKQKGSKELAKVLVFTYATQTPNLWKWIAHPTKEIDNAVKSGLLDLNVSIDTRQGAMPIGQYFEGVKEQTGQAFVVSQEWQDEILPYVERELMKRNMAISDLQVIGFMVAQNVLQSAIAAYGIRNEFKDLIQKMIENISYMRNSGQMPNTPPPPASSSPSSETPPPPTPPSPSSPTPKDPEVEYSENIPNATSNPTNAPIEVFHAEVVHNDPNQGMEMDGVQEIEPHRNFGGIRTTPPADEMEDSPTAGQSLNQQNPF